MCFSPVAFSRSYSKCVYTHLVFAPYIIAHVGSIPIGYVISIVCDSENFTLNPGLSPFARISLQVWNEQFIPRPSLSLETNGSKSSFVLHLSRNYHCTVQWNHHFSKAPELTGVYLCKCFIVHPRVDRTALLNGTRRKLTRNLCTSPSLSDTEWLVLV